jgi:hypothetical protein
MPRSVRSFEPTIEIHKIGLARFLFRMKKEDGIRWSDPFANRYIFLWTAFGRVPGGGGLQRPPQN